VTVTITEKGYDPVPEGTDPATTAPGLLALALARWRDRGSAPPVIASLDNVADNGGLLRARVSEVASGLDPGLAAWIDATVRFPNSVVDRMVPATTERDLEAVGNQLGLIDLAAVVTERHRSWIIDEDECIAPYEQVGVQLVEDVKPFEQRKLWLLNGPHSALAYCGLLFGCATIAEAAAHDTVAQFVGRLVDDLIDGAGLPAALAPASFAADALRRFRNPYLGHTCAQVAADGSRKLPQRFGTVVAVRRRHGLDNARVALVVAAWVAAVAALDVPGATVPAIDDPDEALLAAAAGRDLEHLVRLALSGRFDDAFVTEVVGALERLLREGAGCVGAAA
jgi:fructuronate reductase